MSMHAGGRRFAVVLIGLVLTGSGCGTSSADRPRVASTDRQAEVAEKGASVMPFDLERTTHEFVKTGSGGVQTVVADDPDDAAQIRLIRDHLSHEAREFRAGHFTDPVRIHGDDMPGLDALRTSADRIDIAYVDLPRGGQITYTTAEADLVGALHAWFDAQVSDHGSHATHG